jgi:hypothetical protein
MKEPGLDNRHRDINGRFDPKRSDALNKNLPNPIAGFSGNTSVGFMRKATGKVSLAAITKAPRIVKHR